MKQIKRLVSTLFVTLWVATGCGRETDESAQLHTTTQELEFLQWCQEWQLQCGDGAGNAAQTARMRATLSLMNSGLAGDMNIGLDRAQLEHPGLLTGLEHLGMRDEVEPLLQKLKDSGWNSAQIASGQIQLGFVAPQAFSSKSGLQWQPLEHVTLQATADGQLQADGVQVTSPDGAHKEMVRGMAAQDSEYFRMWGDGVQVKNLPPQFLPQELELPDADLPSPSTTQVASALRPLTEWVLQRNQTVHVPVGAFDGVYRDADVLIGDAAQRDQIRVFASALDSLRATSIAGDKMSVAIQQRANGRLACRVEGSQTIDVKFNGGFGIEYIQPLNNDAVQTRFYGIEIKSKIFGPLSPKFSLKRVDIYADKAVIRDIPIIGSYTLRFDDLMTTSSVRCSN